MDIGKIVFDMCRDYTELLQKTQQLDKAVKLIEKAITDDKQLNEVSLSTISDMKEFIETLNQEEISIET